MGSRVTRRSRLQAKARSGLLRAGLRLPSMLRSGPAPARLQRAVTTIFSNASASAVNFTRRRITVRGEATPAQPVADHDTDGLGAKIQPGDSASAGKGRRRTPRSWRRSLQTGRTRRPRHDHHQRLGSAANLLRASGRDFLCAGPSRPSARRSAHPFLGRAPPLVASRSSLDHRVDHLLALFRRHVLRRCQLPPRRGRGVLGIPGRSWRGGRRLPHLGV